MFFRRQPPPPPPKPFYKNPALVSIVLTLVLVFVLGPVGIIYKGMTEELEKKADNETVIILLKQIKENDDRQWKQIERNREHPQQQQTISAPTNMQMRTETVTVMLGIKDFVDYKNSNAENQQAYRESRPEVDWDRYKRWKK